MHARLDASRRGAPCRLRERHAVHPHGAFTRWANSLFIRWRQQQPNGRHLSTTDHLGHFAAEARPPRDSRRHRQAVPFVNRRCDV